MTFFYAVLITTILVTTNPNPILKMGERRSERFIKIVQGHTTSKCWSLYYKPMESDSRAMIFQSDNRGLLTYFTSGFSLLLTVRHILRLFYHINC